MDKTCKVMYETGDFHKAKERLLIFLPTYSGYIRYDFHHSLDLAINCDCWKIDDCYHCDDCFTVVKKISEKGEWECALRLKNRSDFSGGTAHGDEVCFGFKMVIDGRSIPFSSLNNITDFEELTILESSDLYDPNDSKTKIAVHGKEYIFTKDGLTINQSVKWLVDENLDSCYLAMFPVSKTVTDKVYFDADLTPLSIPASPDIRVKNCKSATIYSDENKFYATFYVKEYPSGYNGSGTLIIVDNNGGPYNKMYYYVCTDGKTYKGLVWKATTGYKISAC